MFIGSTTTSLVNEGMDWVNGVEGKDIFNSKLLFDLKEADYDFEYEVSRNQDRIDLITKGAYPSKNNPDNLEGYLILKNHIDPFEIPRGTKLKCLTQDNLRKLGRL